MLGGPNSFGAGGWTNTKLEEAMPVDFQIKSAKVLPRGALAMMMHASEIAQGNYWQKSDRQGSPGGARAPGLLRRASTGKGRSSGSGRAGWSRWAATARRCWRIWIA